MALAPSGTCAVRCGRPELIHKSSGTETRKAIMPSARRVTRATWVMWSREQEALGFRSLARPTSLASVVGSTGW
eukprot:scaffold649431_cov39-Prasinocladus_malaysianus.AAC.1